MNSAIIPIKSNSINVTFSAIFRIISDQPVVSVRGKQSSRQKPLAHPKSLETFSYAPTGIRSRARSGESHSDYSQKEPLKPPSRSCQ